MQRAPDWTRQIPLTAYLLANRNHKFTSILAVIEPAWINDPNDKNWGDDKRALKNSIEFEALDSSGNIGLINVEKQTILKISGVDKELVAKVAADIKNLKPVEPYKAKGIKERGQFVLRKEGTKK